MAIHDDRATYTQSQSVENCFVKFVRYAPFNHSLTLCVYIKIFPGHLRENNGFGMEQQQPRLQWL